MKTYKITTDMGDRRWQAEDKEHALEQHLDAFSDEEEIISVVEMIEIKSTEISLKDGSVVPGESQWVEKVEPRNKEEE